MLTYVEQKYIILMSNESRKRGKMNDSTKKKMGRPIVGSKKSTRIGIRLDDETLEKLNSYCEKKGLSKSDVIRQALNEYFK